MFTLNQVPRDRHLVMIATGTGLAPWLGAPGNIHLERYW
jgi:ferredoxin-NADP reductase